MCDGEDQPTTRPQDPSGLLQGDTPRLVVPLPSAPWALQFYL